MTANGTRRLPISRRVLCALPVALLGHAHERGRGSTHASSVEREPIATVERAEGLTPPLTLGIARVVLRPGATAWAATPRRRPHDRGRIGRPGRRLDVGRGAGAYSRRICHLRTGTQSDR